MSPPESDPAARVRRWLDEIIVGMNLCPFAAPVLGRGAVRLAVEESAEAARLFARFAEEIERLRATAPDALATTLLIAPSAPADFEEFHGLTGLFEDWLAGQGLDEEFQVVSFHPRFRFAGEDERDLAKFVNRAPYPLWHLLRQADITAVTEAGDAATRRIIERNSELLDGLGPAGVRERYGAHLPEDALPRAPKPRRS